MKKKVFKLARKFGCLTGVLLLFSCGSEETENVELKIIKDRPEMEVAEFSFHKIIVERSEVSAIDIAGWDLGTLPERILILPVDVKVVGKIDFSTVTDQNLIMNDDRVTFVLPDPTLQILSVKCDNQTRKKASREEFYRGGKFSDDDIQNAEKQALDSIMVERSLQLMAKRTCDNAADIIIPLVSMITDVPKDKILVQFRSELNTSKATINDNKIITFKEKGVE